MKPLRFADVGVFLLPEVWFVAINGEKFAHEKERSLLRKYVLMVVLLVGLVACDSTEDDGSAAVSPTAGRIFTLVQLPTPTSPQLPTILPTNTPPGNCDVDQSGLQTRYDIQATLDWNTRSVQVQQTVTYRNDHLEPLYDLVFHVEPRRLAGIMTLQHVYSRDGEPIEGIRLDGWRLVVSLLEPVEPGCEASVRLIYDLRLQPYSADNPIGYLAYTERQLNLAHWFPTIGLYGYQAPGEWYTPRLHYIGEQSTPALADLVARLEVLNAPEDLMLAGPGHITQPQPNIWEFELDNTRDFAISLSTDFQMLSASVEDTNIELYYFPDGADRSSAPPSSRALLDAEQALTLYNELFGAYPRERLVIVEADFPDGMEFTGLVFVSEAWYRVWNGRVSDWLTAITVHEISHQWWYALVANDQGVHPYMDEALATYCELLYYERYYPDLIEWWWDFRVFQHQTEDPVDVTVYDYASWRPYINAVYLRGVRMLQRVRDEVGDEVFLTWLRDYATNYAGKIASPDDFWGSLPTNAYWSVADIRHHYLRQGDILPPMTVTPTALVEAPLD